MHSIGGSDRLSDALSHLQKAYSKPILGAVSMVHPPILGAVNMVHQPRLFCYHRCAGCMRQGLGR